MYLQTVLLQIRRCDRYNVSKFTIPVYSRQYYIFSNLAQNVLRLMVRSSKSRHEFYTSSPRKPFEQEQYIFLNTNKYSKCHHRGKLSSGVLVTLCRATWLLMHMFLWVDILLGKCLCIVWSIPSFSYCAMSFKGSQGLKLLKELKKHNC